MLDALRAATQNWFGRIIMGIVMGLLILAFGFWGIADIFRGFGANDLAHVGPTRSASMPIAMPIRRELQQLQQSARRAITNDEARRDGARSRSLGAPRQRMPFSIRRRIGSASLSPIMMLAEEIVQDPAFKGPDGKFDRQYFDNPAAGNRAHRAAFRRRAAADLSAPADHHRADLWARRAENDGRCHPPLLQRDPQHRLSGAAESQHRRRSSRRPKRDLKAYYDARRAGYRTHEFRKIVVLCRDPPRALRKQLAKKAPISTPMSKSTMRR